MTRRLDVFVPPRPKNWLIRAMAPFNRRVMLKGMLGLRGVSDIPAMDFPADDAARLAAVCGEGRATFVTPKPSRILHGLDAGQGAFSASFP